MRLLSRLLLLVALPCCVAQPRPQPAPPERSGKIIGRVALELEPGASYPAVVVRLVLNDGLELPRSGNHQYQVLNRTNDFSPELIAALRRPGLFSQTVEAPGAFAFSGLAPGLYYVDARIPGSVFGSSEHFSQLTVPDVPVTDGTTQDVGLLTLRKPYNPMDNHPGHETY